MSYRARAVLAAAGLLVAASAASAHGHGRPVYAAAYSYPAYYYYPAVVAAPLLYAAPVYALPAPPPFCPLPALAVAPPAFAQPTPAPPSGRPVPQTTEPPFKQGPPKVTESHSVAGKATFRSEGMTADGVCCRVGFWNVSGRDVTLTVNGQARLLASNQALTLQLDRQFTWQIGQGVPQAERVPADKKALEIVIRQ